jgi:hypothetical protein
MQVTRCRGRVGAAKRQCLSPFQMLMSDARHGQFTGSAEAGFLPRRGLRSITITMELTFLGTRGGINNY